MVRHHVLPDQHMLQVPVLSLWYSLSGVLGPRRGGDDGGESPGRPAADAAVHHEQVSLGGDIQRTTLPPVHG